VSETLPALATRTPADLIAWGRTAIEEAADFLAVKEIRDQAEALRAYQRSVNAAQDVVDAACTSRWCPPATNASWPGRSGSPGRASRSGTAPGTLSDE
jgi:hypothetical protein